jgi:predicted permease
MAGTERLLETLRSSPGVEAAGVSEIIPLTMDISAARFAKDGESQATARAMINSVGPGYFRAMGMRLLAGRDFIANDRAGSAPVVVVNERFAMMNFEGGQAVGHRLRSGREAWADVIGVVTNNSLHNAGEDPPYPQVFLSWAQRPVSSQQRAINLVVRSAGPPDQLVRPVQALAMTLEPDAPTRTRTLRDATAFEMSVRRAAVRLLTALGALGLLLAAIGLYGIVSYLVASQTTELGVRMALGASAPMVLREVLWRGMRLTLWGLACGLVFSLAGARLLAFLLVGLSPADPVSFVGAAVLLLAMGVAASYLPAKRATRTDPMVVLRQS